MVAEILLAAHQERQRLESLLRSNPEFQKLEGVRRIIELYEQEAQALAPAAPILRPDPRGSNSCPTLPADQSAKVSHPAAHSEVRRIIGLYQQEAQALAPAAPILRPDPPGSNSRPALPPDQPAKISRPSAHSEQSDRTSRRRWTWGDSQAAHIRDAAAEYLRGKGKRATSREIYEAIAPKGIEIGSGQPASYVAARLSAASAIFDHSPDGYGLREWPEDRPSEDERMG